MARRKRTDSHEAITSAMTRAVTGAPQPPDFCYVPPAAMPFWNAIISTKDYEMWTPNDLIVASSLARITMEIEHYSNAILNMRNGRIQKEEKSFSVSPLHRVLLDLQSQQINLCRTLQIHARATHGESQFLAKRNRLFHEARQTANSFDEDSLIAMPNKKH
jgi:hypothetical protein